MIDIESKWFLFRRVRMFYHRLRLFSILGFSLWVWDLFCLAILTIHKHKNEAKIENRFFSLLFFIFRRTNGGNDNNENRKSAGNHMCNFPMSHSKWENNFFFLLCSRCCCFLANSKDLSGFSSFSGHLVKWFVAFSFGLLVFGWRFFFLLVFMRELNAVAITTSA